MFSSPHAKVDGKIAVFLVGIKLAFANITGSSFAVTP
jgi:hypothetical protein